MADPSVVFPPRRNYLIEHSGTQKLEDETYEFPEMSEDVFAGIDDYVWDDPDSYPVDQGETSEDNEYIAWLTESGIADSLMSNEPWNDYQNSMVDYIDRATSDSAAWTYIENYLEGLAQDQLSEFLAKTGLGSIYQSGLSIADNISAIKNMFDTDIGEGIAGISQVLNSVENILGQIDQLADLAGTIVGMLENIPDMIGDLVSSFTEKFDFLANMDFSAMFANLPDSILGSLMNIQITQSFFALFRNVQMILKNLQAQFSALKNPKSIKGMIGVIRQLKSMLGMLQALKSQAEAQAQQMKQLVQQMKNGGLQKLATSLLSMISGGSSFIEHPTQYEAKYPENHGYTTPGGHTIEVDSTKGKERFKWTHPANSDKGTSGTSSNGSGDGDENGQSQNSKKRTSLEVHPDGSVTLATKGDNAKIQMTSKKELELDADVIKITARTRLEIQSPDVMKDISGTEMSPGQQTTNLGPNTISGTSVSVNGDTGVAITSPMVVEMAAGLPGGATGGSISIDAITGQIKIISGPGPTGSAAIILDPVSGVSIITQNSLKIAAALGIQEAAFANKLSIVTGARKAISGIESRNAGLISLNG